MILARDTKQDKDSKSPEEPKHEKATKTATQLQVPDHTISDDSEFESDYEDPLPNRGNCSSINDSEQEELLPHQIQSQNSNFDNGINDDSEVDNTASRTPSTSPTESLEVNGPPRDQTRDRSVSDLCEQLARSFNREEGPDPKPLIDAGGEQLSGKNGDVGGSKLKMPRGGACNFSPDFSGNFQAENWNKLRRHETTSQLTNDNMPDIARYVPCSNLNDIKKGSIVQFKGHDDDDEWHECEVTNCVG